MTLGDLIFVVSRKTGLDDTAATDERTLLVKWANDGVVKVLIQTGCHVEIGDMPLTIAKAEYRTDATMLSAKDFRSANSPNSTIELISMGQMLVQQLSAQSGSPIRQVAIDGDFLIVYPTPSVADTIRWIYVPKPTRMTADANDLAVVTYGGIQEEYQDAVEMYMVWQAGLYDDKRAPEPPKELFAQFRLRCNEIKNELRKKGGVKQKRPIVGYPGGQVTVAKRNDVYP